MLNTKFYKTELKTQAQLNAYTTAAEWCNSNNATIEDKGEYYEVVAIPEPSLDEVKTAKIAELKMIRDKKELEPVVYNGSSFDFDSKSYERITAAIYALDLQGTGATINWTLADNSVASVTANNLQGVIAAAAVRSNALHTVYRGLKEQVQAAETVEAVNTITWLEE